MKKIVVLFSCISFPVFASPPILETDMLDKSEHLLGGVISKTKANLKGDFNTTTKVRGSDKTTSLSLLYGYGISHDQMFTIELPYNLLNSSNIDFTFPGNTLATVEASNIGLGDITIDYKTILFQSPRQRFNLGAGIRFPVGSDDAGSPKIVENGVKTQSKKNGGAGSGRTDYKLETNYSFLFSRTVLFANGKYILKGIKTEDGEEIKENDEMLFSGGILQKLTKKTDVTISLVYGVFRPVKTGDVKTSRSSVYRLSIEIFYKIADDFIISPKLAYMNFTEVKYTSDSDNSITRVSDLRGTSVDLLLQYSF